MFQDIVTSAVEKVLPDMLRQQLTSILQDILPAMLTGPSPSPSLSPTPSSLAYPLPAQRHQRTPAAAFRAVVSTHTQNHLKRLFTDAMDQVHDQASELYITAGVEFSEELDDHRLFWV
jgi:cation transport regulator ChaB